jgi:hypothetical protein
VFEKRPTRKFSAAKYKNMITIIFSLLRVTYPVS